MDRNNRTPGNNNEMFFDNEKNGQNIKRANNADDIFVDGNTHGRKRRKKSGKSRAPKRSLFMEYVHCWYVFIITVLTCIPAYVMEIFLGSLFIAKNMPPMAASLLSMFLGGFVATLPLLILNIYLVVKKKKYFAIGVQIIAIELIGLLFYLYSKISFAWS